MVTTALYNGQIPPGASQAHASAIAMPVVPDAISMSELQAYQAITQQGKPRVTADELDLHEEKQRLLIEEAKGNVVANTTEFAGSLFGNTAAKAAGLAGPFGYAGSLAVSAFSGSRSADHDIKELTALHMDAIVQELGIHPSQVTADHLRHLAEKPGQEQLRTQIEELDQRVARNVTKSGAGLVGSGIGASVAAGALATIATGGTAPLIAGAVWLGGSVVGGMVASNVAEKAVNDVTGIDPKQTGAAELKRMSQKLQNREPVNAVDVFKALVAGDKDLQTAIKHQTGGKRFDELNVTQQAQLMETQYPKLLEASQQLAYMVNVGAIQPTRIMTIPTISLNHPVHGGAQAAHDLVVNDIKYGRGTNIMQSQTATLTVDQHLYEQMHTQGPAEQQLRTQMQEQSPVEQQLRMQMQEQGPAEQQLRAQMQEQQMNAPKAGGFVEAEMRRRGAANNIVSFNRSNSSFVEAEMQRRAAAAAQEQTVSI